MENNYLKIKSKVYKCGDLDGEKKQQIKIYNFIKENIKK